MKADEAALEIGRGFARRIFAKRGNHSEAHLSEAELAAIIAAAIEYALSKVQA